jgi:hypothetical protein
MSENVWFARGWVGGLIAFFAACVGYSLYSLFTTGLATGWGGFGFAFLFAITLFVGFNLMLFTVNCWTTIMEYNDKKTEMKYIKQANQLKIG